MKLSEAVAEIENDKTKVFESISINPYDGVLRLSIRDDRYFEIINLSTGKNQSLTNIDRVWAEIKKPVTWQEAIQAWATKKTVSMIDGNGTEWIYDDTKAMEFVEEEILYGTWYIK